LPLWTISQLSGTRAPSGSKKHNQARIHGPSRSTTDSFRQQPRAIPRSRAGHQSGFRGCKPIFFSYRSQAGVPKSSLVERCSEETARTILFSTHGAFHNHAALEWFRIEAKKEARSFGALGSSGTSIAMSVETRIIVMRGQPTTMSAFLTPSNSFKKRLASWFASADKRRY
jgi:hypothetical protein